MSQILALKLLGSLGDLANILGYQKKTLSYILYIELSSRKYTSFTIPKKNGGTREISAPTDKLKNLQQKLAHVLTTCYLEIHGDSSGQIAHGFLPDRSIASNAKKHKKKRFVFNVDINDFFGSINFGRVRGFFISDRNFELDPKVATIIAQIACYKNSLPQGSPCSPIISNLIGHILDIHMVKLAKTCGCTYSRYADDLTFSSNKAVFPEQIATKNDSHEWIAGSELTRLVERSGFTLNPRKTRMQYKTSRQEVTGLVVNKRVNVKNSYRKNVRAMVHRLIQTGSFDLPSERNNETVFQRDTGTLEQLHGMLGYIDWIDNYNASYQTSNGAKSNSVGIRPTYKKFLLYKEFYATPAPVLLCEGKTDPIYITHAIRSLASSFPSLATVDTSGKIKILLRRFKYAETSTGEILGIKSGGTSHLKTFLTTYTTEMKKFIAPAMRHPVIVLVDNDKAGHEVFSVAKRLKNSKNPLDPNQEFIHVSKNLYLLATPKKASSNSSEIEDMFDEPTLNTKIGGKKFDGSNHRNGGNAYGKNIFAHKVIIPNTDKIDFSGFIPLLNRFEAIIEHYSNHVLADEMSIPDQER